MTGNQILDAARAVNELSALVLPYHVARRLAALKDRLEKERRVIVEQEEKIMKKHGGKLKTSGTYTFETPEQAEACAAEMDEYKAQEDDIKLPTVDLSKYTDMIRISASSIAALEGIVIFEAGDKKEAD